MSRSLQIFVLNMIRSFPDVKETLIDGLGGKEKELKLIETKE